MSLRNIGRNLELAAKELGRNSGLATVNKELDVLKARRNELRQQSLAARGPLYKMEKHTPKKSALEKKLKVRVHFTNIRSLFEETLFRAQRGYYNQHIDKKTSFELWRKELDEAAERIIKDTEVWTRCTSETLKTMLRVPDEADRRFKSQFETKSSGRLYHPGIRADAEQEFAKYPLDLDPKLRIIYGYLSKDSQGSIKGSKWLVPYGEVRVCFKDCVKQYTSFFVGDTLSMDRLLAKPVPYESPNGDCFPLCSEVDPRTFRDINDIPPQMAGIYTPYAEAEVHYGARVKDIAKVVIPEGDQELVDLLEADSVRSEFLQKR